MNLVDALVKHICMFGVLSNSVRNAKGYSGHYKIIFVFSKDHHFIRLFDTVILA